MPSIRTPASGQTTPSIQCTAQQPIRVLFIEDIEVEAELALMQLKRAGFACESLCVETEAELRKALDEFRPTIILSDFKLPQFDGMAALRISHEIAPDVPFIFLSGTIGEERAIEALLCGAMDYVLKHNPARLVPAVRRALADAAARELRKQQQAQIARLDRVLRMLSGVNALTARTRDRKELLKETCRLSVTIGGYACAVVCTKTPGVASVQPVGWHGVNERLTEALRAVVAEAATHVDSVIGRVVQSAEPFISNDTASLEGTGNLATLMTKAEMGSLAALPLVIDGTAVGVLVLVAQGAGAISGEELRMLREVAGNLSFALQYLQQDTKVRFLSHFDPQTGLAKRSLFVERLSRLIAHPAGKRSRYAIAVIDIERLSVINDTYSWRTGDLLLQHVADRFKRRFPQTEHLAHFGGGTFAVIRDLGTSSGEDILQIAHEHGAAIFGEPFTIEGREIPVAVRSGFALFPDHGRDANVLVQNAEAALHRARAIGERHIHYSAERHSELVARMALEHKLRLALEKRQYVLHYQPKVSVITRRIQGVEALIRWNDPDSGLISPAAFLPLLESTGMIVDVGEWVIQRADEDCQQWQRAGLPPVRIAVNISPAQLRLPGFVPQFLKAMQGWSGEGWGLDIEITEGALNEDSAAEVKKLRTLRTLGVRIAIDDFGTGYSSLSRLSSLPIDTLKIDRNFIRPVPQDAQGKVLVKTIISLAKAFGLTSVAEGVETQDQLDFLWQSGCDQSQGYLHSKPVAADEFAALLEHGKGSLVLPAEKDSERTASR